MSTVKISKIKLPKQETATGQNIPWRGDVHSNSESLYLPDPSEKKTLIINTEDDKITGVLEDTGSNSIASVCQDRGLLFLTGSSDGEARVYKIGTGKPHMPLKFDFPPHNISLDSDRDILLVSNGKYLFFRYPERKDMNFPRISGDVIHTKFDDLEDSFIILFQNPSHLVMIKSGEELSLTRDISFGDEIVNSAVVYSVEKKIVAGTESGKIIVSDLDGKSFTDAATFKEPVKKILFNPLVNHLYVIFKNSRQLAVVDLQNNRVREMEKCSSEISDIVFDDLHNKIYALLPSIPALEAYLDMGR